jgi:hypothetical protein
MSILIQIIATGLMATSIIALVAIIGFIIYAEFFNDARFSRTHAYLTTEEMLMIQEAENNTLNPLDNGDKAN